MAQIEKIFSRSTSDKNIAMWGTLHVARPGGELVGWLVDSWTLWGIGPRLRPKMHWVPREDGKFYLVHLSIGPRSSISIEGEDTEIEPQRAEFITSTLAKWEQEWIEEQSKG
jgi:hypothetical protein